MDSRNNRNSKRRRGALWTVLALAVALTIALAMTLSFAGCGNEESESPSDSSSKAISDFQAQTLDGEKVTEDIFAESKLTMVNIWATYCGPCINEMPDLGEIGREYEKSKFQIVGVVSDISAPNDATAEEIINETKADYVHIVPSDELENSLMAGVSAVPTTIFIDKNGMVIGEPYVGSRSKSDWEDIIKETFKSIAKAEADATKAVGDTAQTSAVNEGETEEAPLPKCSGCRRFTENLKRIQEQSDAE